MMWNGKQNSLSGTRFSKALKIFQAHQAIFSHFYLQMKKSICLKLLESREPLFLLKIYE